MVQKVRQCPTTEGPSKDLFKKKKNVPFGLPDLDSREDHGDWGFNLDYLHWSRWKKETVHSAYTHWPTNLCRVTHAMDADFRHGYGSIHINTMFRGMNIHLPAILTRFRPSATWPKCSPPGIGEWNVNTCLWSKTPMCSMLEFPV